MPSAFSSPNPAASTSRANSTPPVPTNRRACISAWNSVSTSSTSPPSTLSSRMSSLVSFSTSDGRSWARTAPASSFDSWARKTAAFRSPDSSLRGTGICAVFAGIPTSRSTLAMLIYTPPVRYRSGYAALLDTVERLRDSSSGLREPAAEHGGDLVGAVADHLGDLAAHPLTLGGLDLRLAVVEGRVADALHLDPLVVQRLVVLEVLVLLPAAP